MPETGKPEFTFDEVREAVSILDVADQHVVLAALTELAAKRRAAEEAAELTRETIYFAVVYERAAGDNVSTSNIEGWYEELEVSAAELLETIDGRQELSEIEILARDTAAVVYAYLSLEHDKDAVDFGLLEQAGVDKDELLKRFRKGIIEERVAQGADRAEAAVETTVHYKTLNDFSYNMHAGYWERIVRPLASELRAKLIESGVILPELNEEGKYGEDDELEIR